MITPATSVMADVDAGAYLAARQAGAHSDFASSARYYTKALLQDPSNSYMLENAMNSFIALGQFSRAVPVAQVMVDQGISSQIAHLVLSVENAKTGDWSDIFSALEQGRTVGPLVDGLAQGWAHLGEGDMSRALASFDQVIETRGMEVYGMTHKAYALASVGDFEGAAALFERPVSGGLRYSRTSAIAHAQILSQLDRNSDALAILQAIFGRQMDPAVALIRDALEAGDAVAYSAVPSPEAGMADLYHMIAGLVEDEAPASFTLMYARAAMYLDPSNTPAILMTAGLLEDMGQYDLANSAFSSVATDDPSFHAAELGRAEALRSAGRDDAAIEVLEALTRTHPELPQVWATKGDTFRQTERYNQANDAYTKALDLYDDESAARWFVHYTRGITNHALNLWPAAEADFRAALELNPDHPQVLNYLGYSLVERGEKLDEALEMIETAAAARPDNGAIIDSLGWVYFQLGRYDEALVHLERASSLLPTDPVVNDHLGDVFWVVGRMTEARFQWQRALSFDPEADDALRIRDKLSRGLDMVLKDEGEDPIRVARGND
ncbi:tetratricopeptide repeat protein [Cognatiyoonia sp. IB215446]|uniref:tetratricopeptide repeat protein n=1 Tax=Cognatiyoonia sp. IB215446 TaxID=3097355 RepID=UPI002A16303E|nr:tetratricopeptide repeat protein [Cognatiyoonia sp. IB215446]MDX8346620.1 tetratricopeptide repeat protein [Cognatiyoonia sp. IB215446]